MENMKLFKVTIVLISLLLSSTAMAGSKTPGDAKGHIGDMPAPKWLGDDLKYSMPAFLFRRTQFLRFSLKRTEKKMHESAVFFALTSTQNGKIVSWYSKERLAAGKVQGDTLIPNLGRILPYVPSIHQSQRQGTTHHQQRLQIHRHTQLVFLQIISRYRHK